jgi:FixJ family two-component response regulator
MKSDPVVFVLDPDDASRDAICNLVCTMSIRCESFSSGEEFLDRYQLSQPGCLVLEVRIPDMSGLEIQSRLTAWGATTPVIFTAAQSTISIAVRAMRNGALHFLEKPLRQHELWDAVQEGIRVDAMRRREHFEQESFASSLSRLNPRERQVLNRIAEGKSKKTAAAELGVCVRTIELRRAEIMRKLGINSNVELLRFALRANEGFVNDDGGAMRVLAGTISVSGEEIEEPFSRRAR